ncbi:MAG: hypothetical protein HYU64_08545 [Armatimonadetes bacterium]|nr:hypothetical protein [Armatimonadota bacterium]
MAEITFETTEINEPVQGFYGNPDGYYAVSTNGRIINIVRSASIQPEIRNHEDYVTYLWVEAQEGFFVFSQRVLNQRCEEWMVRRRITPSDKAEFFASHKDELIRSLTSEVTS